MTISNCRKRIREAVSTLNKGDHKLTFAFEENEYSIYLTARSSGNPDRHFGAYEMIMLFDDFKNKTKAYEYFMLSAERMAASTKLCDPGAYHNTIS